jgi:hypothetical protein
MKAISACRLRAPPARKRQVRATSPARASRAHGANSRTFAAGPSRPAAAAGPCAPACALPAASGWPAASGRPVSCRAAPRCEARAKRVWLRARARRAVTPKRQGEASGPAVRARVGAPVTGPASARVRGRASAAPRRRPPERSTTNRLPRNRRQQTISNSSETLGQAPGFDPSLARREITTFSCESSADRGPRTLVPWAALARFGAVAWRWITTVLPGGLSLVDPTQ